MQKQTEQEMTDYKDRFVTIEQMEDALEERQMEDRRKEEQEKTKNLKEELRKKDRRTPPSE